MYSSKTKTDKNGNIYFEFYDSNGKILLTPGKTKVTTKYSQLADKLVMDLNEYGESPKDALSIVAFHYTMVEYFSKYTQKELIKILCDSFLLGTDWTSKCPTANPDAWMEWVSYFGNNWEERKKAIIELFHEKSNMELCAMCCLGNYYESINIPYILFILMNKNGKISVKASNQLAKMIEVYYQYVSKKESIIVFNNFQLYTNLERMKS